MTTIIDIAKAAGVSQATAARALGGYGSVSAKAKEQVLAAADSLGYQRNELAASLVAGSTRTIGLVVGDIENPFFASVVRGLTDVVEVDGHTVLLANSDEDLDRERHSVDALCSRQVDGLVIATAAADEVSHLESAARSGRPVVLIDRPVPESSFDTVTVENEAGAARAVQHLIELGHRADRDRHRRAQYRLERGAAQRLPPGAPRGRPRARRVADRRGRPRAGGRPARGARAARAEQPPDGGVHRVQPGDLRRRSPRSTSSACAFPTTSPLVGFDDFPLATVIDPPMTVVSQPVAQIGREAGRLLIERLAGEDRPPQRVELATELIVRRSCGARSGDA